MIPEIISKFINSAGLISDIAGAWLVSWEVVRQFQGNKVEVSGGVLCTDYFGSDGTPVVAGQQTEETQEFKFWETKKYLRMKIGLAFLTIGFILQIAACWTYSRQNNESTNNTQEIKSPAKPEQRITRDSAPPPIQTTKPKTMNPTPDK